MITDNLPFCTNLFFCNNFERNLIEKSETMKNMTEIWVEKGKIEKNEFDHVGVEILKMASKFEFGKFGSINECKYSSRLLSSIRNGLSVIALWDPASFYFHVFEIS